MATTSDMTASKAIQQVKSLRSLAIPNFGFQKQLERYGERFEIKLKPLENDASDLHIEVVVPVTA